MDGTTVDYRYSNYNKRQDLLRWRTATVAWLVMLGISVLPRPAGAIRQEEPEPLYIAGFFPMSQGIKEGALGRGVLPAVRLAIDDVNNDTSLLQGYKLELMYNDTQCQMAFATKQFFEMMHYKPPKVMLFGPACPSVTGPIAEVSQWWKIWQLSYADMNPELHDRKKYPNLFRTVPSDTDFNPARIALLEHFHWRFVAVIHQDATRGTGRYDYASSALVKMLVDKGYKVLTQSFTNDPSHAIKYLRDNDVRIIIGNFDEVMARRVFCEAYRQEVYGPKIIWIVLGSWETNWWREKDHQCTSYQLLTAMNGYIATDVVPLADYKGKTVANKTIAEYERDYNSVRKGEYSKFHGYAYDGIWVIAKALDRIARKKRPGRRLIVHKDMRAPKVHKALNRTNFIGVTGQVKFRNGERLGEIAILQFRSLSGSSNDGEMVRIGTYTAINRTLNLSDGKMYWRGGEPPLDIITEETKMARVDLGIYIALSIICALGIVVAILFAYVNIRYRKHRFIKMSSPRMNNMILFGCVLGYCSVFLLGVDGGLIQQNHFHIICTVRCWVLAVGFTFAFGSMFSKTWRVHAIFTNIKLSKKVIKDYKLLLIVAFLLFIDLCILTTWQVADPLVRRTRNLSKILLDGGDRAVIPQIEFCSSDHLKIWMGIIYAYKGILLVFGCFLAWETRQVSIPALNDSKYVGMSVYNVVIMCVSGAATSFVIRDQVNASFIIMALCIIFCTSITLGLVFLPKIITIRKDPKGEERRIRATLKKINKKESDSSIDIRQHLKIVLEQNVRLRKIRDELTRDFDKLTTRGTSKAAANRATPNGSPAYYKPSKKLRTVNSSPVHLFKVAACDSESIYSTTSVTNLWPVDSSPQHRIFIQSRTRTPSIDTRATEAFELSDMGVRPSLTIEDNNTRARVSFEATTDTDTDDDSRSETVNTRTAQHRKAANALRLFVIDPKKKKNISINEKPSDIQMNSVNSLPDTKRIIPVIIEELADSRSSLEINVERDGLYNLPGSTNMKDSAMDSLLPTPCYDTDLLTPTSETSSMSIVNREDSGFREEEPGRSDTFDELTTIAGDATSLRGHGSREDVRGEARILELPGDSTSKSLSSPRGSPSRPRREIKPCKYCDIIDYI